MKEARSKAERKQGMVGGEEKLAETACGENKALNRFGFGLIGTSQLVPQS